MIKAVTRPPTRGPRFVANMTTGEVHDLARVCASCRVSKIKDRRNSDSLDSLEFQLRGKMKKHKDCFQK
ncbi:MAG: hypothetical protein WBV94_09075 [Blastocatellia bacterium]